MAPRRACAAPPTQAAAPPPEGINPSLVIIAVVAVVLVAIVGYAIHRDAEYRKLARPPKKVGAKKAKREKLKNGLAPPE